MSLSANGKLKRISEQVLIAGYKVSSIRVREACLENNFTVNRAVLMLIRQEQLKISLENLCIKNGYNPNKKLIICSCNKYNFKSRKVEQYIMKLLKARKSVHEQCIKSNINISDTELDESIIGAFGNESRAFNKIQLDH